MFDQEYEFVFPHFTVTVDRDRNIKVKKMVVGLWNFEVVLSAGSNGDILSIGDERVRLKVPGLHPGETGVSLKLGGEDKFLVAYMYYGIRFVTRGVDIHSSKGLVMARAWEDVPYKFDLRPHIPKFVAMLVNSDIVVSADSPDPINILGKSPIGFPDFKVTKNSRYRIHSVPPNTDLNGSRWLMAEQTDTGLVFVAVGP